MDLAESQDVALTVVIGDDERELAEHFSQPATIKGMIGGHTDHIPDEVVLLTESTGYINFPETVDVDQLNAQLAAVDNWTERKAPLMI